MATDLRMRNTTREMGVMMSKTSAVIEPSNLSKNNLLRKSW